MYDQESTEQGLRTEVCAVSPNPKTYLPVLGKRPLQINVTGSSRVCLNCKVQVSRLQGVIEAHQLASNVAEDTLRDMLAHERRRSERLARERDAALHSRLDSGP